MAQREPGIEDLEEKNGSIVVFSRKVDKAVVIMKNGVLGLIKTGDGRSKGR
jgi:hypothetical protein